MDFMFTPEDRGEELLILITKNNDLLIELMKKQNHQKY